ncbi:hypothetical protein [Tenacibaculum sp. 190524A02b]
MNEEVIADTWIQEMEDLELTPKQMLVVIELAKDKCEQFIS